MKTMHKKSGRRSMALVVTLVLVTLTSALVVAFAMRARLDLAASSSFAATPQADGIARGGVEYVLGWFTRQIQNGSQGYNADGEPVEGDNAVVFLPKTDANALPQRVARRGGAADGPNYQSLIGMSKRGVPFFSTGDGWQFDGAEATDVASDVSSKEPSANGRRFGASRWLAPGLMTLEEATDFDDKSAREEVVPDWIYVTRQGPERVTEIGKNQREDDPENPKFVLGRFAYTVYDVSGLLDVGIAGYPGTMDDYDVQAKNSLAWADPSAMQLPSGGVVNRQQLVDWRNKATKSDFLGYVTNAIKEGFQTNAAGDNAFFGRRDLVGFARAAATKQILDTNALPYVTAFSRERAAPSWYPRIQESVKNRVKIDYEKKAFEEGATNRWTAAVTAKVDFDAPDGMKFKAGDPLLKRRFALSRINMLKRDSGADPRAIWYYFGLVSRGDAGRGSGITEWVYNPVSQAPQEQERVLYTLDEVALRGREPNFFELINAGILHGSMGKSGYREGMDLRLGRDRSVYHQVLQIGANIIDQYDTDSDPTIIRSISDEAVKQGYHNTVNLLASSIRGIENLPYIDEFLTTFMRDRSKTVPNTPDAQLWVQAPISGPPHWGDNKDNKVPFVTYFFQFELWNPHRNAKDGKESRYRLIAQTGNTYLDWRPYLQGNNRNTGGGSPDPRIFDPENVTGQGGTQEVTYNDLFQMQVRNRYDMRAYGRDFARNPCIMEFSGGKSGAFFDIPKLLQYDDPDLDMRVTNPLDTFKKLQASITGLRLGDALVVKNLDLDNDPNNDFEWFHWDTSIGRWVHRDNHIYPYFQGNQPLVIELQKQSETTGGWFTYQVFAPRKTGTQLSGVPGFDHSGYCWAYLPLHNLLYGRRWPVGHSFNPVSDPRCQRYGFTHGGGIGGGTYEYEKAVGATLRDMPKDAHRKMSDFEGKEGDSTRIQYKTYKEHSPGWQFPAWIAPYSANPTAADWTSSDNNIDIDKDTLWFWYKWVDGVGTPYYQTAVAEFAENNDAKGRMGNPISMMFSRDEDGLVRRGDSWRARQVNPYSMQMEAEDNVGRPVFLNRPFQSVGELGYVLRDDPWKTLNLFWGDSADAGLLDLFCLEEGGAYRPVRNGVLNPNTAPKEVLTAVLAGTALHGKIMDGEPRRLTDEGAAQIAQAIRDYLGPMSNPTKVLRNIGDIAELTEEIFEGQGGAAALQEMRDTDVGREALARALADVCNTRTWNLFFDVVAQAGRFTEASRQATDFVVRGERRIWVHMALDRLTGELVDVDIEPVFE